MTALLLGLILMSSVGWAAETENGGSERAALPARNAARTSQPDAANAERGKRLFMAYYCYSCHGTEGQGGAGPKILARASADPLIRYVRKPTGGNMPPYTSKVIADQDLVDINAYLRSIPGSPSAKSIALLQQ